MTSILEFGKPYTFSKIFELKAEVDDLITEFGYSFQRHALDLPKYFGNLDREQETLNRINDILPYVNLANEATRREILIAPVVTDLVHYTRSQLRIEYPIKVTEHLQGNFDYLLRSNTLVIIIEAKHDDLYNGFTQLATELIALDHWEKSPDCTHFLGAVTSGTIWQIGLLHRQAKLIQQDLNIYRVPSDFEILMRILVRALLDE